MRKIFIFFVTFATAFGLACANFAPLAAHAQTTVTKKVAAKTLVKTPAKKKVTPKKKSKRTAYLYSKSYYNDAAYGNSSTTRCLTQATKTLYANAVKTMEKDIQKSGDASSTAATDYRQKMDVTWSAMFQPYCGRGSRGITVAQHAFDKSFSHARDTFLKAVKGASH